MRKWSLLLALLWLNSGFALAAPAGWSAKQSKEILDQTRELWLAPELDDLSPGERLAIDKLVAAGRILQQVYERQVHPDSALAKARLDALPDDPQTLQLRVVGGLATLNQYRLHEEPFWSKRLSSLTQGRVR